MRRAYTVRRRTLAAIGTHLAHMHGEEFVHSDCHARNILVRLDDDEPHVVFLDCRRGGTPTPRRTLLVDLATLDGDLVDLVSATDRLRMLRTYLPEGEPSRKLHARIGRKRERLLRRDARRGRARR